MTISEWIVFGSLMIIILCAARIVCRLMDETEGDIWKR